MRSSGPLRVRPVPSARSRACAPPVPLVPIRKSARRTRTSGGERPSEEMHRSYPSPRRRPRVAGAATGTQPALRQRVAEAITGDGGRVDGRGAVLSEAGWYVALGDSMSIDLYPLLELRESGAVGAGQSAAVGAAALFHENADALWPEFAGRDLAHMLPGIQRMDVTADGAVIDSVLRSQLPTIAPAVGDAARVVTLTAGGNDLLGGLFGGLEGLVTATDVAVERYGGLVELLVKRFPDATLLLTTVYDPTDGSGLLPGASEVLGRLPMELLDRFNEAVREAAGAHDRAIVADVHRHFLGHGLSAPAAERWYWHPSPIEPGARGASEIRRVWLDALEGSGPGRR